MTAVTALGPETTNGAAAVIDMSVPYGVRMRIRGIADLLFHRWNVEEVEAKGKAAKGSKAKKTDNIESYVYRNDANELCLPGEYIRQAIINAAKFRQDPRSPRKSAMDLFKAGIVALTPLAPIYLPAPLGEASRDQAGLGRAWHGMAPITLWSYEHRCRVTVQRNGITRTRPAIKTGWEVEAEFMVNLPEYIAIDSLHDVTVNAGRLVGVGDSRPTYGRFQVVRFEPMGLL